MNLYTREITGFLLLNLLKTGFNLEKVCCLPVRYEECWFTEHIVVSDGDWRYAVFPSVTICALTLFTVSWVFRKEKIKKKKKFPSFLFFFPGENLWRKEIQSTVSIINRRRWSKKICL